MVFTKISSHLGQSRRGRFGGRWASCGIDLGGPRREDSQGFRGNLKLSKFESELQSRRLVFPRLPACPSPNKTLAASPPAAHLGRRVRLCHFYPFFGVVLKDPSPSPGRSRCDGRRSAPSDCRRAHNPCPEEGSHPTSP